MNYKKNGDAFINYLSITPIHDSAGSLTHYVGIQSDITELVQQRQAELAARHAALQVGFRVQSLRFWVVGFTIKGLGYRVSSDRWS
jgi:hypothetical protein